ncbi:unnamed protein product [Symbiodinium natans]|uniref:Uncharacterized protein n=1 Tax=Symbiodinium natans TaxID=878477 RepID=A0A812QGH6_9DINO|nr:unnamed protein product [Symbiodinium natans]
MSDGEDVLAEARKAIEAAKKNKEKAAAAKVHDYGFGFGCSQEPKGLWIPSKFVSEREEVWKNAGMTSFEEYMQRTHNGAFFRRYQKRHLFRTNGVHWDTDIRVAGAGIEACNGRYILDQKRLWRNAPVWHHEKGACDAQWDGVGGGATILQDMKGRVDGDNGGLNWLLFYKGGPRYLAGDLDTPAGVPTSHWKVLYEDHSWDGVPTVGPPPESRHADWSYTMGELLKAEAHEEANFNEAAGDCWLVDLLDREDASSQNWVIKRLEEPESGGLFCCSVPRPKMDSEMALYRDGKKVLDKIYTATLGNGAFGPLSVCLTVSGLADGTRKYYEIILQRGPVPEQALEMIKMSRAFDSKASRAPNRGQ